VQPPLFQSPTHLCEREEFPCKLFQFQSVKFNGNHKNISLEKQHVEQSFATKVSSSIHPQQWCVITQDHSELVHAHCTCPRNLKLFAFGDTWLLKDLKDEEPYVYSLPLFVNHTFEHNSETGNERFHKAEKVKQEIIARAKLKHDQSQP